METAAKTALAPVIAKPTLSEPKPPEPKLAEPKPIPTPALLLAMLKVSGKVSDLIMSPGSYPVVELSGKLVPVKISGMAPLTPEDTRRIAYELIAGNKQAIDALQNQGSCDISYRLPGPLPVSRQHFSAARQPRHCHARDPAGHSDARPL